MNRLHLIQHCAPENPPADPDQVPSSRLLVPVDLSASSVELLDCAKMLARRFDARVEFLYVVHLNIVGEESGIPRSGLIRQLADDARGELHKLIAMFWEGDLEAAIVIREGPPHQVILREAHDFKPSLIIMGARNRVGLSRLLRRHTLARVLRHAPCPVLAVRIADRLVQPRFDANGENEVPDAGFKWLKRVIPKRVHANRVSPGS